MKSVWKTIRDALEQPGVLYFIVFAIVMTCLLICSVNMERKIEQYEQTVESYEKRISEYSSLLEAVEGENVNLVERNAELQDALTGLQSDLEALKEEHKGCRPPVVYSSENVLTPSYVTVEELYSGLLYGLKDYAGYFVDAEQKYGINAIFLASVAALESGWCRTEIALNNNNLFGYKNSTGDGFRKFSTKAESIYVVAKHLKDNYLTEGGTYYNGLSVEDVNIKYCEQKWWASEINAVAKGIVERIYGDKGEYYS